ncbi:MAG: hypothetical protein BWY47_00233 [Bacteroidetes bacterium ADurb.Bin302]|nr:MAG: hypothetical protein BWY47_00233 [Bacteroidetes bacterium ADurb.Bin302]
MSDDLKTTLSGCPAAEVMVMESMLDEASG